MSQPVRVGIVGAGIAGLTAALRLAERGYRVTVYEEKPYVGGEFGAHTHDGGRTYHEHSFHMLLNWYRNFWALVADLGIDRAAAFEPRHAIHVLRRGEFPRTAALRGFGSLTDAGASLCSGIVPVPDMFLYWYSLVDLLAQPFDHGLLGQFTVNGFMQSRPYASEASAHMHREVLAKAFASPSYLTSARAYQSFVRHGVREPRPLLWVMRGNVHETLHRHLLARLRALDVEVRLQAPVRRVEAALRRRGEPRATAVVYAGTPYRWPCLAGTLRFRPDRPVLRTPSSAVLPPPGPPGPDPVDYLVLAVPPRALTALARASPLDLVPGASFDVATLPQLHSEPMASMDLRFAGRLPGLPREHVLLEGSALGLSFIDNARAWGEPRGTNLNLVASRFAVAANMAPHSAAEAMGRQLLADYLPGFQDESPQVHFQPNVGDELFINEVGSEQWRPGPTTRVPNVFLAGDYCDTFVDVVSVEGAVVSGLNAARALQAQVAADDRGAGRLLDPIEIVRPPASADAAMVALKVLLAPCAAAAKAWSRLHEELRARARPAGVRSAAGLASEAMSLLWAPYTLAAELWKAVPALGLTAAAPERRTRPTSARSTRSGTAASRRARGDGRRGPVPTARSRRPGSR